MAKRGRLWKAREREVLAWASRPPSAPAEGEGGGGGGSGAGPAPGPAPPGQTRADWAELPGELLEKVGRAVPAGCRLWFRLVCRSWAAAGAGVP